MVLVSRFCNSGQRRDVGVKQCVIKQIDTRKLSKAKRDEAKLEVKLLNKLEHPHVVKYIDSFESSGALHIVMEHCSKGDLGKKLKAIKQRGRRMTEGAAWKIVLQIADALGYIHSMKVLHRDIKPANIFLSDSGDVKIGDFGVSKLLDHTADLALTRVGTPYFMSPELCEGKPYDSKCDVWALGCLAYECCMLRPPFDASSIGQLVLKITKGRYPPVDSSHFSPALRGMIDRCLQRSQKNR
eukprot:SAG31_NODE_537_length_14325_cov_19.890881_4_plen_241_part_00